MHTTFRICIDQYARNNINIIITDNIPGQYYDKDNAKEVMNTLISNVIKESNDTLKCCDSEYGHILYSLDKNGNKLYHAHYYITCINSHIEDSDKTVYEYRNFTIRKKKDKWHVYADEGAMMSIKNNIEEAFLYIDYFIASLRNIEFFDKCIQIADDLLAESDEDN